VSTPAAIAADLYEMANLYPRTTGLPMTVWVSPRGGARHDARIEVSPQPGDRMVPEGAASVAIRPEPRLVAGNLDAAAFRAVAGWIAVNREVLLDYWDGTADTADLIQRLSRV
jgi:hypothetical protein